MPVRPGLGAGIFGKTVTRNCPPEVSQGDPGRQEGQAGPSPCGVSSPCRAAERAVCRIRARALAGGSDGGGQVQQAPAGGFFLTVQASPFHSVVLSSRYPGVVNVTWVHSTVASRSFQGVFPRLRAGRPPGMAASHRRLAPLSGRSPGKKRRVREALRGEMRS